MTLVQSVKAMHACLVLCFIITASEEWAGGNRPSDVCVARQLHPHSFVVSIIDVVVRLQLVNVQTTHHCFVNFQLSSGLNAAAFWAILCQSSCR